MNGKYLFKERLNLVYEGLKVSWKCFDKSIRCPHCDIRFDRWKDADYFTCPQCKIRYCAKCSAEYEKHKDFTCEEYEENIDKTVEEQAFYKEMRSKGYRKCPGCFCFVERA